MITGMVIAIVTAIVMVIVFVIVVAVMQRPALFRKPPKHAPVPISRRTTSWMNAPLVCRCSTPCHPSARQCPPQPQHPCPTTAWPPMPPTAATSHTPHPRLPVPAPISIRLPPPPRLSTCPPLIHAGIVHPCGRAPWALGLGNPRAVHAGPTCKAVVRAVRPMAVGG